MNVKATADEVIQRLKSFTDKERQDATQNYFPSAQANLGVYAADMRSVVRDLRQRTKGETAADVIALAHALIARKTLEGRQAAYEIVAAHKPAFAALKLADVEKLGKGIDNWASVDGFATTIAGRVWLTGQLKDADIQRWARSKDPWWRRAALASTVCLNLKSRGGSGDSKRTMAICEMLADDDHIMVHKALSWALRSVIEHDRKAVETFLKRHELPALVKREVLRKLKTGRKYG
jgi:3-methyladenine DNA glycosylase AlkD